MESQEKDFPRRSGDTVTRKCSSFRRKTKSWIGCFPISAPGILS